MEVYNPKWSYTDRIVKNLMRIQSAKDIVSLLELPIDIEERLKKESVFKTVHYSTKIEGNNLSLDEVRKVIEGEKVSNKNDVLEVKNYYNALVYLDKKAEKKSKVTIDLIQELHFIIDNRGLSGKKQKSAFREGQNVVKDSASGAIAYLPPEAKDVEVLMNSLVKWINDSMSKDIPSPIISAISAYQLLTIHPYWDGNGRTARALATYILKISEYDLKGFYSMEEFYDRDISKYYESIQMRLHHNYYFGRNDADLTRWILYFLEIMVDVFENVKNRVVEIFNSGKSEVSVFDGMDKRRRIVANHILKNASIQTKDVIGYFNVDKKTARIWIDGWIGDGFLENKNPNKTRYVEYILTEKYSSPLKNNK
jgi:Fic family protein